MKPRERREREERIRAEGYLEGYRDAMREVLELSILARNTSQQDMAHPHRRIRAKPEALAWRRLHPNEPVPDRFPPGVELPPPMPEPIPAEDPSEYSFNLRLRTPQERAALEAQRKVEAEQRRAEEEERRRLRMRRWVYFVQEGESGPVKIGFSRDVPRRMSELQRQAKAPLRLLASMQGTRKDEAELHARFAQHRLHGEWFHPAPELLEHASAVAAEKRG